MRPIECIRQAQTFMHQFVPEKSLRSGLYAFSMHIIKVATPIFFLLAGLLYFTKIPHFGILATSVTVLGVSYSLFRFSQIIYTKGSGTPNEPITPSITICPIELPYDGSLINDKYVQTPHPCENMINFELSRHFPLDMNSKLPLNCLRVAVSRRGSNTTKPVHFYSYSFLEVFITHFDDAGRMSRLFSHIPLYDLKINRFLFETEYAEGKIGSLIRSNRQEFFEFETFLEHIYNSTGHHTADCSEQCGLSIKSHAKLQEILNTISRHDPKFQADAVKDAKEVLNEVKQSVERAHLQNRTKSASKK